MNSATFTYQARIIAEDFQEDLLSFFASLYGKVERSLFADFMKGKDLNSLKSAYQLRYEITARQFNAIKVGLEGKIKSVKEVRKGHIQQLKDKIAFLEKKLSKIKKAETIHHKTRKLYAMKEKLARLELEHKEGKVSLCFGSKRLFRAQYALEENGYSSFEEWKKDWNLARNSEFFLLGSKDETAGNQSCVLPFHEEEKAFLRVRLPNALAKSLGKYVVLQEITFSYGYKEIRRALESKQALSYRFKKDEKGWRVFVSFTQEAPPITTKSSLGAIGLDINAHHIAAVEIDSQGNQIQKRTFPLNAYGKTKDQAKALIGDVCKEIVFLAKDLEKPLVVEKLDFSQKKASLKESYPKYARMLSSFHYSHTLEALYAKSFKEGVEVHSVNPSMTSIIGKIKFAKRYGFSTHHGAAFVIARRHFRFSEAPSKSPMKVVHKNVHVTSLAPVRKRGEHVWKFWKAANRELQTALAALFRARKRSPCTA